MAALQQLPPALSIINTMRVTTFLTFFLLALLSVLSFAAAEPLPADSLAARDDPAIDIDPTEGSGGTDDDNDKRVCPSGWGFCLNDWGKCCPLGGRCCGGGWCCKRGYVLVLWLALLPFTN
jgi:hypothetical protein